MLPWMTGLWNRTGTLLILSDEVIKMKYIQYILFGAVMWFASCQHEDAVLEHDRSVYLSAIVEGSKATRAPYTYATPSVKNELHAAVWVSSTDKQFMNTGANGSDTYGGEVAKYTKANFQNATDQLLIDIIYPKVGNSVHFVGMYPERLSGESLWRGNQDGTEAYAIFHGYEDIMFAPQATGTYGLATNPLLKFHHLLTWLRIQMVAESEDASDAWGKIEDITIRSSNLVTIKIDKGAEISGGYNRFEHVDFSNPTDLSIYFTDNATSQDLVFPKDWVMKNGKDYTLHGPKKGNETAWENYVQDVGYVMCAPVDASASDTDYTLTLKTGRGTIQIPLNLMTGENIPYSENTMGRQFTVLLRFKIGDNIAVSSSLGNKWSTGGIGYGDVEE